MARTNRDRTLALAGVFQAANLVQEVATQGGCDEAALETCINSVFNREPKDAETVYGSALCLTTGLRLLNTQFNGQTRQRDMELTKYVLGILYLERKLAKDKVLLEKLGKGIERAEGQLHHFPPTHSNILASLADTYSNTVSTITPRLIIHGEQGFLTNPEIANKIRALLLAGIRSAVLWSQCGGSRLTLLFGRNKLITEAKHILNSVHS